LPSVEYDLGYLRACQGCLEDYLLSDELYWSVDAPVPAGESIYPRLTPGGFLLAQKRLLARTLNLDHQMVFSRLLPEVDAIRSRWRVAWEKKAGRDFHSRLGMWRNFIEEYRREPEEQYDRYPYEVRLRVMLQLLQPEAALFSPAEQEMLAGLDQLLKAVIVEGNFIWEADLQKGFPHQEYWYLYGLLPVHLHNGGTHLDVD
jgi:hypothetical protein